ncbi:hypothetical protein ACQ4M3_00675 [Leptolyngbya sp. AN03gr2]|uniref:hypothetical protein n=1 Tax=unclassified Leptolyngbya TaxID=2650499 RepID=UPI003D313FF7
MLTAFMSGGRGMIIMKFGKKCDKVRVARAIAFMAKHLAGLMETTKSILLEASVQNAMLSWVN